MDRLYCTINELIDDLDQAGVKAWKTNQVMSCIQPASDWIDRALGQFIPTSETRKVDGPEASDDGVDLYVSPLLAVTSIIDEGNNSGLALLTSDFVLYPQKRWWENGPYTRIRVDPDAANLYAWSVGHDNISIAGRWGKYEKTKVTGATVASQTNAALSLVVDNAAAISPGAVLLIETEQELVTAMGLPTDSTTNTNGALDNLTEEVILLDASQVNIGEVIQVGFEQMMLRDKATNTLLVTRGWNGTKIVSHLTNLDVFVYRTFTVSRGVNGTTAAQHTSKAVSQYIPPADVNYLCRQIAALMMKKAQSGFAGKIGNPELGEVFYMQEFPKEAIERIKLNYTIPLI